MGTWQNVAKAAKVSLKNGRSVVIDNTNPDVESRSRYLDIAKELKVPARCFVFDVPLEHAKHNERFRRLVPKLVPPKDKNEKLHTKVPDVAFHSFKNKFKMPTTSEGFIEVKTIKFQAKFDDDRLEALYKSYLIDK